MSEVSLHVDGTGKGQLVVDGHDVSMITGSAYVHVEAGRPPVIRLDVVPSSLAITGQLDVRPEISDALSAVLVAGGWTPPADDNRVEEF